MRGLMEHWKKILGYPNYEVSDKGRVRVLDRIVHSRTKDGVPYTARRRGKIIIKLGGSGYKQVLLVNDEGYKRIYVHRIVARMFLGKPPKGKRYVMHKDDVRSNNRVTNLAWCSTRENVDDMLSKGRQARGSRSGKAVLTEDIVMQMVPLINAGFGCVEIGRRFGVNRMTVTGVMKGRTWTHVTGFQKTINW